MSDDAHCRAWQNIRATIGRRRRIEVWLDACRRNSGTGMRAWFDRPSSSLRFVLVVPQAGTLASVGTPDCSGTPLAAAVIAETTSEGAM